MSYKPRIAKEIPLLVPEGRKQEKIAEFKSEANRYESDKGIRYPFTRTENDREYLDRDPIDKYHGQSFITEVIPELKRNKKEGKIKILILGAGAALYADQIRGIFKDDIVVFTGLKKKNAKLARKELAKQFWHPLKEPKLNKRDLIQPSILFLHDFPEFDLIIDTYGEQFYSTNVIEEREKDGNWSYVAAERKIPETKEYLSAVIKKLAIGGKASISPFSFAKSREADLLFRQLCEDFSTSFATVNMTIKMVGKYWCLDINKNKIK